jgi:hypothetical protein
MHAHVLLFLPAVAFLVHAFLPKIDFLYAFAYIQQAPNINMWLVSSHLTSVCFVNIPGDRLELLHELCCMRLGLHNVLLECVQYLHCNITANNIFTLLLGLCHICFGFLFLCNDLCCSLLERFHLVLALLFLCLHSYEFCLQLLHVLCPFDTLYD